LAPHNLMSRLGDSKKCGLGSSYYDGQTPALKQIQESNDVLGQTARPFSWPIFLFGLCELYVYAYIATMHLDNRCDSIGSRRTPSH